MAIKIDGIVVAGKGKDGIGIPEGGTAGQVLAKKSETDYDIEWIDAPEGGSGITSEQVDQKISDAIANKVDNTTTINGKALSEDITLNASDVGTYTSSKISQMVTTATQNKVSSTSVTSIVSMTQAEYDALATKDETTLYLIKEETS